MLIFGLILSAIIFVSVLAVVIITLISDRKAVRAVHNNRISRRILERGHDFPIVRDYMDDLIEYHKTHEKVMYDIESNTEHNH